MTRARRLLAAPEAPSAELHASDQTVVIDTTAALGGITSDDEEFALESLNQWVIDQGLPAGQLSYDHTDPDTGEQRAVFDLAWPDGLQAELSEPVAVLLNEDAATLAMASAAGFRCFTHDAEFREYVTREILALEGAA